mgnify:CR=1 FL=1
MYKEREEREMLKLMKYLKKSVGSIVLIIGLLFLQAYCDLSLPDYTSKIINVGIQTTDFILLVEFNLFKYFVCHYRADKNT